MRVFKVFLCLAVISGVVFAEDTSHMSSAAIIKTEIDLGKLPQREDKPKIDVMLKPGFKISLPAHDHACNDSDEEYQDFSASIDRGVLEQRSKVVKKGKITSEHEATQDIELVQKDYKGIEAVVGFLRRGTRFKVHRSTGATIPVRFYMWPTSQDLEKNVSITEP